MKRGFTLIELLVVMIIVGVLVTIALPKYRASLERGRAMEGMANLRAASDWINTQYILHGNSYTDAAPYFTVSETNASGTTTTTIGNLTRSMYFTTPTVEGSCTATTCSISTYRRQGTTNYYKLVAHNENGRLDYITCPKGGGTQISLCAAIGLTPYMEGTSNTFYKITF